VAQKRIRMSSLAIAVVTCTIYYKDKFLVIRRRDAAKKFGGSWGFPGGKVEQGETIMGALVREVEEETGLTLEDRILFIDSYYYGDSIGLHFTAFATSDKVTPEPGVEYAWLGTLEELQKLPRIPGIDFHITQTQALLQKKDAFLSLDTLNYTPDKYVN
jgi:mutator protein MutT